MPSHEMLVKTSNPSDPDSPITHIVLNNPTDSDLKYVNYNVGTGGGGYNPTLRIATVYASQPTMDHFIDFYNAHKTTTHVCVDNASGTWTMVWWST